MKRKDPIKIFIKSCFSIIFLLPVTLFSQGKYDITKDPEVLEAMSKAMSNPVSELIIGEIQMDFTQIAVQTLPTFTHTDSSFTMNPGGSVGKFSQRYTFVPTFPIPITKKIVLVSRLAIPYLVVPFKEELGNYLTSVPGGGLLADSSFRSTIKDPFGKTSGLGDLVYVGLFAPKKGVTTAAGSSIFYGLGPTVMIPTASSSLLGTGRWSGGPAFVFGHISKRWHILTLVQQYWGKDLSIMTGQYAIFYAPDPTWNIGMSPTFTINWKAPTNQQITFPVGFGANHTFYFGELPVAIGFEGYYSVMHPETYPGSRMAFRVYVIPVIPAPWSNLGKTIKERKAIHQ